MSLIPNKKPVNYLNNKDILKEIHLSKNAYCAFKEPDKDHRYDFIVDLPGEPLQKSFEYMCNPETLQTARENHAARLSVEKGEKIDPATVKDTDLVFRVMTWDHVPVAPKQPRKVDKKKTAKDIFEFEDESEELFADLEDNAKDSIGKEEVDDLVHVRVNFPPFQHYRFTRGGNVKCVGKSHWVGDLKTGEFSKDHGNITNKLAKMYIMMCEK